MAFCMDNRPLERQKAQEGSTIGYHTRGDKLFVAYNASSHDAQIELPAGAWEVLADGQCTDYEGEEQTPQWGKISVPAGSGVLLGYLRED